MFRIFFPLNIDSLFQHKKCFHLLFILEYSLASICGWKVKKKKVNSWTMIISIFMLIKILHLSKNLTLWIIKTMKSTKIDIQCKLNYLRSENFFPLMICTLSVGRHSHRMGTVVKFLLSLKVIWKKRCFSINFNVKTYLCFAS